MLNRKNIFALYKKELLEFIRDRRTFMIMLLIPALLYPGMIIVTLQMTAKQQQSIKAIEHRVAVPEEYKEHRLVKMLDEKKYIKIIYASKPDLEYQRVFIQPPADFIQKSGLPVFVCLPVIIMRVCCLCDDV